jgi:hypothetical protein
MTEFKFMYLSAYTTYRGRGDHRVIERMVSIHADDGRDAERTDGMNYVSFFMTEEEFTGVMKGEIGAVTDIGHNLRVDGERFTFFDLDLGYRHETRGIMRVPYVIMMVPYHVRKILLRAVQRTWNRCLPDGDRLRIDIPLATRERWLSKYGQGKGEVLIDLVNGEKTKEFFDECQAAGGKTFSDCIDRLVAIARNTTFKNNERGVVKLFKDWDGFYFNILGPDGHSRMNGGVINHGRDGTHDWSTHT